jgi:hypothetical protein
MPTPRLCRLGLSRWAPDLVSGGGCRQVVGIILAAGGALSSREERGEGDGQAEARKSPRGHWLAMRPPSGKSLPAMIMRCAQLRRTCC